MIKLFKAFWRHNRFIAAGIGIIAVSYLLSSVLLVIRLLTDGVGVFLTR